MSYARIVHTWPDGSTDLLEVGTKTAGYPDVLAECVAEVKALWREVCVDVEGEPDVETG